MPNYLVKVSQTRVVKENIPVTAANPAAAEAAALVLSSNQTVNKNEGVTYVAVATVVA